MCDPHTHPQLLNVYNDYALVYFVTFTLVGGTKSSGCGLA